MNLGDVQPGAPTIVERGGETLVVVATAERTLGCVTVVDLETGRLMPIPMRTEVRDVPDNLQRAARSTRRELDHPWMVGFAMVMTWTGVVALFGGIAVALVAAAVRLVRWGLGWP